MLISTNSWSNNWGNAGDFYIKYADISSLFSLYAMIDSSKVDKIKNILSDRARASADKAHIK
jgi:C1A family cysteine protease